MGREQSLSLTLPRVAASCWVGRRELTPPRPTDQRFASAARQRATSAAVEASCGALDPPSSSCRMVPRAACRAPRRPLVERVHAPDHALDEDAVLVQGDQRAQPLGSEPVDEQRGARPVAREHLVRSSRSIVAGPGPTPPAPPAPRLPSCRASAPRPGPGSSRAASRGDHRRLWLASGATKSTGMSCVPGGSTGRRRADRRSPARPRPPGRCPPDRLAVARHALAVALHVGLLQIGGRYFRYWS